MIILAVICLGIVAGMGLTSFIEDLRAEWKLIKKERKLMKCQRCGHQPHQHDEQGNCLYKPKPGYPKK